MAGKKDREYQENIKALTQNIELVDLPEVKQKVMERKLASRVTSGNDMELN